jgi:hypothetical protein
MWNAAKAQIEQEKQQQIEKTKADAELQALIKANPQTALETLIENYTKAFNQCVVDIRASKTESLILQKAADSFEGSQTLLKQIWVVLTKNSEKESHALDLIIEELEK